MKGLFRRIAVKPFAPVQRAFSPVPTDLVLLVGFALVSAWVLVTDSGLSSVGRAVVGVPLVFLAPGYAVVSLLAPRSTDAPLSAATTTTGDRSVDSLPQATVGGRVALSFGVSVAVLPILGVGIGLVAGFTPSVVAVAVSGFVVVLATVAAIRRLRVPPANRFRVRLTETVRRGGAWFLGGSGFQTMANVALVVGMLLAVTTGGYALLAPQSGEQYTDLQLLTENDSGDLVAADYPDAIEPGESIPITVAVENREGEATNYTLVVQQQRVDGGEVVERELLDRVGYNLSAGGTGYGDRNVTPTATDGEIRIAFLLYEHGEVPDSPTRENAYRQTHIWTEVGTTPASGTAGGGGADTGSGDSDDTDAGSGAGGDTETGDGSDGGEDGGPGDDGGDDGPGTGDDTEDDSGAGTGPGTGDDDGSDTGDDTDGDAGGDDGAGFGGDTGPGFEFG